MRNPWGMGAVAAIVLAALPTIAAAQAKPPYDPAIDVQLFEWAIGPKTFFSVADADVADKKQLSFDAVLTYLTNPFVVYNVTPGTTNTIDGQRTDVVHSVTAAQIAAAYGLSDKYQLGFALPIIFKLEGDGLDPATGGPTAGGLNVSGIGDLRVELKARLWQDHALRLGGIIGGTIPTSVGTDSSQFIGDDLPGLRGKLAVQWDSGRLSLAANAGVIIRKSREIYAVKFGDQFVWGAAAAFRVTDHLSVIGEGIGRTGLTSLDTEASPIEVVGGLRINATSSINVVAGGGAGLTHGIGSPESQFFLSVGYAPDVRDSDGDGIPNSRDKCPLVPEDKDGFQDEDGCPDDDNDGDRTPDATDKCPNQAEDIDGFEDDDGCPDLDNDKDGIPDLQDKCPNEPEDGLPPFPNDGCPANKRDSDGDGIMDADDKCPLEEEDFDHFEDGDGCPDLDNDNDGIPDAIDKCPLCPEDKDGFQDADGCPDLDNDNDGIPDARDACPNEPETVNGFQDADGCPDTGGLNVVRLDGDRLVVDKVPALDGRNLSKAGELVVQQMALVMAGHHEVSKWLLAVEQPSAGAAKLLGAVLKAELQKRGVAAEITVLEKAGGNKVGGAVQERFDADAAPVCPAGMEVHERPEAAAKKGGAAPSTENAVPAPVPTPAPVVTPVAAPTDEVEMEPAAPAAPPDRDGDGIPDAIDKCPDQPETKNGYQDDDGCPDEVPTALKKFSGSVQGVAFKSGSADLLPASLKILDAAAEALGQFPDLKVEVQGHTDDVAPGRGGKFADNLALSQARADAVRDYLVKKGVDTARLTPKGYGDTRPLTKPKGLKGGALNTARTKNRRVEFKIGQ